MLCIPSNVGSTQIGTVHQTDAVQYSDSYYQTAVDAMDDLLLFFRSELAFITGVIVDILLERYGSLLHVVVARDRI